MLSVGHQKNIYKADFMTDEEYRCLCDTVSENYGFMIKGDKKLTMHTKLSHRLKLLGLSSYTDYIKYIENDLTKHELGNLISHITNSETYFFRERPQLDFYSELLKELKKEKQKSDSKELRMLSVGCSSGEEPYTLNIITLESGLFIWDWDVKITGIDVNKNLIERAKKAVYTGNSLRQMNGDNALKEKYFYNENNRYVLKRTFTKNVEFKHCNIVAGESFKNFKGTDVVFCRNVLIYMNDNAFGRIMKNIFDCISDSGYLFIGSSESLIQRTNLFVPEYRNGIIIYRKNVKS